MNLSDNTILITGGATGIGLALAEELVKLKNTVIICGRRKEKLDEAKAKLPELITVQSDISSPKQREELLNFIKKEHGGLNILVNNAGMQRMIDLTKGVEELDAGDNEIRINLEGTIYLTAVLIGHLMKQTEPAIVNVSSGLGFVPISFAPIYCATKAAIHSYTLSLRHQLKNTPVKVFEVIPPIVDTELDRGTRAKRGMTYRGISPAECVKEIINGLENNIYQLPVERAKNLVEACGAEFEQIFKNMNRD